MPRQARLDAPGALHHVMGRGIEGTTIFRRDEDREDFLTWLGSLCEGEAGRDDGALWVRQVICICTYVPLLVQYNESAKKGEEVISSMEKENQLVNPIQNLVVAKYRDGRMIKGVTYNFGAGKKAFHVIHITEKKKEGTRKGVEVVISELKAIFFVKSLEGRIGPRNLEGLLEEEEKEEQEAAINVRVTFHDGETLIGMTHGYSRERQGFFIVPLEKESNNLRIFVVFNAAKEIEILK